MKAKDYIIIGGAVALLLLWQKNKTKKVSKSSATDGGVGGTGATQGASMPTSSEPEQVYGLNLPTGMDLPVLTAGTGTPTEVAVQQGLGTTEPTPAVVMPKALATSDILIVDGIKPIVRPLEIEPITTAPEPTPIIIPRPLPTINLKEAQTL